MFNGKRYNSIDNYYKLTFGCKVYKLALSINATCPNRDGSKGVGGCKFCSGRGSGEYAKVTTQIGDAIALLGEKATGAYIAYFQSFSNTYMQVGELKQHVDLALAYQGVVGIAIATRADCISNAMYEYLAWLNTQTHLVIELGLQTIRDDVNDMLNRHTQYAEFLHCIEELKAHNIKFCVHIMDGLPSESRLDMLNTARAVAEMSPHSIKIHMLNVLEGTSIADEYLKGEFQLMNMVEYTDILIEQLRILDSKVYIERVTGDGERKSIIAPKWVLSKRYFLNNLDERLKELDAVQGDRASIDERI